MQTSIIKIFLGKGFKKNVSTEILEGGRGSISGPSTKRERERERGGGGGGGVEGRERNVLKGGRVV